MNDQNMQIPTRKEVIHRMKSQGKLIAGVLPIHYPRELLRAYRIHPMEIWGPPYIRSSIGNRHFQSYTCSIVRHATSLLLDGGLRCTSMLLIPHTCDALQGMGSVIQDFIRPTQQVLPFYLPRGNRPSDENFLIEEFKKLAVKLETISGHVPSEHDILESIQQEQKIEQKITSLYQNRETIDLSDRAFYSLLRAREYLPNDEFLQLISTVPKGGRDISRINLMISGIVPEPMDIFDHINQMGAHIVSDDLACCSRRIYPPIESSDPYEIMARRILSAPPCPTRGSPVSSRVAYIKQKMQDSGAQGLIIYDVKFCEPELFDVPLLRKSLTNSGIPVLHIEYDMGESMIQQTITRIEAFVEMLQ